MLEENRYLESAGILQLKDEKQSEYVQSVVKADLEEAGDEDVIRKLKADLENHHITEEEIKKNHRI